MIERTREVGLLRAVGVDRRQLRTMIRLESVVVAVLGGVLGTVMGVLFGATVVSALKDEGLTELAVPWPCSAASCSWRRSRGCSRPCSRHGARPVSTCSKPSEPSDESRNLRNLRSPSGATLARFLPTT